MTLLSILHIDVIQITYNFPSDSVQRKSNCLLVHCQLYLFACGCTLTMWAKHHVDFVSRILLKEQLDIQMQNKSRRVPDDPCNSINTNTDVCSDFANANHEPNI